MKNNPLYNAKNTPAFDIIKPKHTEAISIIIDENKKNIEQLLQQSSFTWQSLMLPLAKMEDRLSKAFSPISHLNAVMSNDDWREAYQNALPILSEYGNDLSQNEQLYEAIKSIKNGAEFEQLSKAQQKTINDNLQGFELSGVALPEDKKKIFKANNLRLSELSMQFSNHVLDATNAWHLQLNDAQRLSGVPESAKALMQDLAKQNDQSGYRLTLDAPVVIPILSYADDRELRAIVYKAYNARASELSDQGKYDNTEIITEILKLRQAQAELIGFDNYAALSVADKMTKTTATVNQFLSDLCDKSYQAGKQDMQELADFAAKNLNISQLEPWDINYASEKLRIAKYDLSQEDLRPYFPVDKVLEGLFAITEKLFKITFKANDKLSTWHKDVKAFDVINEQGEIQAHFYLDPYARQKKRGGAWMDGAATRFNDGDHTQIPVAYLVCNFTPPIGDAPAYLTHDEVTTLFHEFGHGLHHMLTEIDIYDIAGINGVEWDAVEQPSQFMENFCFDKDCLAMMTAHQETGATLPDDLFQKLIAAKNYHAAMAMLRQLEFAIFDFQLHEQSSNEKTALEVLKEVQDKVSVTPRYQDTRFPMQFSHIFAGGYAAGYYSYKWAEVLSADSFSAFMEEGILNPETGARFKKEILATGASRTSLESFTAFRGRAPSVDALLEQNGI